MHFYVDDKWELYDLDNDKEEMNNLYDKPGYEIITKQLKESLDSLQIVYDVPEDLCR